MTTTKKTTTKGPRKKEQKVTAVPSSPKLYTFEQWAARRSVREHHKDGLRAFVKNISKKRSLEEWDACFKNY